MKAATARRIRDGRLPKGDVLAAARFAGIAAAKKTPEIIPLCHPVRIDSAEVEARVLPALQRLGGRLEETTMVRLNAAAESSGDYAAAAALLDGVPPDAAKNPSDCET